MSAATGSSSSASSSSIEDRNEGEAEENKSSAQRFPRFPIADFHRQRSFAFGGGKNGEKIEQLDAGVVSAVDNARGQIKRIARIHQALLLLHPLLGRS